MGERIVDELVTTIEFDTGEAVRSLGDLSRPLRLELNIDALQLSLDTLQELPPPRWHLPARFVRWLVRRWLARFITGLRIDLARLRVGEEG